MKDIESAKVVFIDSNQEYLLSTRTNSNCHFFEELEVGGDIVKLRLDWGDLDINGYPTLDANFFNPETGKKRKLKGKRKASHHTQVIDNSGRSYEWEFDNFSLNFKVVISFQASISENLTAGDSYSAEVIKAKSKS